MTRLRTLDEARAETPRCWYCGAEPDMVDVTTYEDPEPRLTPGGWDTPAGDHQHAIQPPTPSELAAAGDAAIGRIRRELAR